MNLLLLQMGLLLAVALLAGRLARALRQPAVIGEILAGLLLGPTVLGHVWPALEQRLFAPSGMSTARETIVELGMVFFLFTAGLEVRLDAVRNRWAGVLSTGFLGSLFPFALGLTAAYTSKWWMPEGEALSGASMWILGVALSISALPVIVRILMDLNLLQSRLGTVALVGSAIGDLLGWTVFAGILSWHRNPSLSIGWRIFQVLACTAGLIGFGRFVAPWALAQAQRWGKQGSVLGTLCAMILLMAALAEAIGIHAAFGAFVLGVSLGHTMYKKGDTPGHAILQQFSIHFFAPLYFISIGLRLDFSAHFHWILVLVVTLLACIGKVLGASIGARWAGLPPREAWGVGFAMNARGAMGIVLAGVALDGRLIHENLFVALVTMALLTTLISAPLLKRLAKPHNERLNEENLSRTF